MRHNPRYTLDDRETLLSGTEFTVGVSLTSAYILRETFESPDPHQDLINLGVPSIRALSMIYTQALERARQFVEVELDDDDPHFKSLHYLNWLMSQARKAPIHPCDRQSDYLFKVKEGDCFYAFSESTGEWIECRVRYLKHTVVGVSVQPGKTRNIPLQSARFVTGTDLRALAARAASDNPQDQVFVERWIATTREPTLTYREFVQEAVHAALLG